MRERDPVTPDPLRASTGCLPPGPGAATSAAAAPGSGVVRASIEVQARVDEALRRWSEFSALAERSPAPTIPSHAFVSRVDFETLDAARSRVTLQLEHRGSLPEPARARRALEDHLVAFGGFVDENGSLRCRSACW